MSIYSNGQGVSGAGTPGSTGRTSQQLLYKPFINNGNFFVIAQTEIDLFEVDKIKQAKNQLSIPDCSSLVYAKVINGILLTGDKNLRITAKTKEIEVRGHLWVFDEMVRMNVLSPKNAIDKLNEHEAARWLSKDQLDSVNWLPADKEVLDKLR